MRTPTRTGTYLRLGAIICIAIALRLLFFTGLSGADPQDDGIYLEEARRVWHGQWNLDRYVGWTPEKGANPAQSFQFRVLTYLPSVLCWKLFGVSEHATVLWSFLLSILMVLTAFGLGRAFYGRRTGLLAALLLAFFPLNLFSATRLLSDLPSAALSGLAMLAVVHSARRNQASPGRYHLLGGFLLGLAYLTRATSVIIAPLLALFLWRRSRSLGASVQPVLLVAGGLVTVLVCEWSIYGVTTGRPLLGVEIGTAAFDHTYAHDPKVVTQVTDWLTLRLAHGHSYFQQLWQALDLVESRPKTDYFSRYYWLLLVALAAHLYRRKLNVLVLWLLLVWFFYELSPIGLSWDAENQTILYDFISKRARYLSAITLPMVVLVAAFIIRLNKKWIQAPIVLALFAHSLLAMQLNHRYHRGSFAELRTASEFLQAVPGGTVYSDYLGIGCLRFFGGYDDRSYRILDQTNPRNSIRNAWVVLGGSRGRDLHTDQSALGLKDEFYELIENPDSRPAHWHLVRTIAGEPHPNRKHDMVIFHVTEPAPTAEN